MARAAATWRCRRAAAAPAEAIVATEAPWFAYCYRSGQIGFARELPPGTLPISAAPDREHLSCVISANARLAYDGETLLVPGIPEADDEIDALDALHVFRARVERAFGRGAEVRA